MSRHGRCRCGAMLKFRKRHGYKTRCRACGKVVRLQPDEPSATAPQSAAAPDMSDDSHWFENCTEPQMAAYRNDSGGIAAEMAVKPVALCAEPADPPWTWQWLAVAAGLVVWVGLLSILSWWWWQ